MALEYILSVFLSIADCKKWYKSGTLFRALKNKNRLRGYSEAIFW